MAVRDDVRRRASLKSDLLAKEALCIAQRAAVLASQPAHERFCVTVP